MRKAIELSPRDEQYQFNLVQLYLEGKKFDEAASILRVLQWSSDQQIAARSAEQLLRVQKYSEQTPTAEPASGRDATAESFKPNTPSPVPEPEPESPEVELAPREVAPSSEGKIMFRASTSLVLVDVLTQD